MQPEKIKYAHVEMLCLDHCTLL